MFQLTSGKATAGVCFQAWNQVTETCHLHQRKALVNFLKLNINEILVIILCSHTSPTADFFLQLEKETYSIHNI